MVSMFEVFQVSVNIIASCDYALNTLLSKVLVIQLFILISAKFLNPFNFKVIILLPFPDLQFSNTLVNSLLKGILGKLKNNNLHIKKESLGRNKDYLQLVVVFSVGIQILNY